MKSRGDERILSKLIERNIRDGSNREEIARRLLVERRHMYLPLIAVSREKGSGGTHIAHLAADRLGFECFDRRIVDFIAERADIRKEVVALVDEKTQHGILQQMADLFQPLGLSEDQYFHHLMQVISTIARVGSAVLIGRGANFLLGPTEALKVRVACPFNERVKNLQERDGVSREAARKIILDVEKEREAFIGKWFRKRMNDPHEHDLIINTQFITDDTAAELIYQAYLQRFRVAEEALQSRKGAREPADSATLTP